MLPRSNSSAAMSLRPQKCSARKLCRMRRAVSKTSTVIASLPSAIRLVRFFHVDGAELTR